MKMNNYKVRVWHMWAMTWFVKEIEVKAHNKQEAEQKATEVAQVEHHTYKIGNIYV